jgi:hypothetical protein
MLRGAWYAVCTLQSACQRKREKTKGPNPARFEPLEDVSVCRSAGQLVDGLLHLVENGALRGTLLVGLGLDHRLGCRSLPGLEIEQDALAGLRHASHEPRHTARGRRGLDHLGRTAQLALSLGSRFEILRAEVTAVVVPAVGVDRLDLIVAHLALVHEGLPLLRPPLARIAHRDEEALRVERVALGERDAGRHALPRVGVVNGCGALARLDLALLGGRVAHHRHLGGLVLLEVGRGGRVGVDGRNERDQIGERHGGVSCVGVACCTLGSSHVVNGSALSSLVRRAVAWPTLCTLQSTYQPQKKRGEVVIPPPLTVRTERAGPSPAQHVRAVASTARPSDVRGRGTTPTDSGTPCSCRPASSGPLAPPRCATGWCGGRRAPTWRSSCRSRRQPR